MEFVEKIEEVAREEEGWISAGTIEVPITDRPAVVAEQYVSGNREQEEEAEYKARKVEEQDADKLTASMIRQMQARFEQELDKRDRLISQLTAKIGSLVIPQSAEKEAEEFMQNRLSDVLKGKKTVKIIIQTSDNPSMNFPVFVGVNGQNWELPRGQVVEVPVAVVEVLANAKIEGLQKLVTPDGEVSTMPVKYSRFPFTLWQ